VLQRAGAADHVALVDRLDLVQRESAFIHLLEQLVQDRDLDRRRRRKLRGCVTLEPVTTRQIHNGVANDAVHASGDRFELLREGELQLCLGIGGKKRDRADRVQCKAGHPVIFTATAV
jgi:hypothetical protein